MVVAKAARLWDLNHFKVSHARDTIVFVRRSEVILPSSL
jgi:hypothetical protein